MNNIVILVILAIFGLMILRVAWNKRIKYSYGHPDIEDSEEAKELAALQALDDSQIRDIHSRVRDPKAAMAYKKQHGNRVSMPSSSSAKYRKRFRQETARTMGTISE